MRHLPWAIYGILLGVTLTCVVIYRHANDLEQGALSFQGYDSRRASLRPMPESVYRALPPIAREHVHASCNQEGGDVLGRVNCYHEAQIWMRDLAREERSRQKAASTGLLAVLATASLHAWVKRRNRLKEARLRAALEG